MQGVRGGEQHKIWIRTHCCCFFRHFFFVSDSIKIIYSIQSMYFYWWESKTQPREGKWLTQSHCGFLAPSAAHLPSQRGGNTSAHNFGLADPLRRELPRDLGRHLVHLEQTTPSGLHFLYCNRWTGDNNPSQSVFHPSIRRPYWPPTQHLTSQYPGRKEILHHLKILRQILTEQKHKESEPGGEASSQHCVKLFRLLRLPKFETLLWMLYTQHTHTVVTNFSLRWLTPPPHMPPPCPGCYIWYDECRPGCCQLMTEANHPQLTHQDWGGGLGASPTHVAISFSGLPLSYWGDWGPGL